MSVDKRLLEELSDADGKVHTTKKSYPPEDKLSLKVPLKGKEKTTVIKKLK